MASSTKQAAQMHVQDPAHASEQTVQPHVQDPAHASEQTVQPYVQDPAHADTSFFGFGGITIILIVVLLLMSILFILKRKFLNISKESQPVFSENDRKALNLIVALANLQKKIDSK